MSEKYLLFNLDDEKSKKLGEVISNTSCKKIINLLADKEAGISEIAKELGMPLNSVQYSVEKLKGAGLIAEAKSFWSVKGKKMPSYKLVNKAIVISPKGSIYSKIRGILPVIVTGIVFTGFILWESVGERISGGEVFSAKTQAPEMLRGVADSVSAGSTAESAASAIQASSGFSSTSWFLIGIWALLVLFMIWSFSRKKE